MTSSTAPRPNGRERNKRATRRALRAAILALGDDELAGLAGSAEPGAALWGQLTALFAADADRVGADGPEFSRRMEPQRRAPELRSRQMGEFVRFEARLSAAITARLPDDDAGRLRASVMSGSCITAVRVGLERWAGAGWRGSPRPHVEAAFALLAPAFTA